MKTEILKATNHIEGTSTERAKAETESLYLELSREAKRMGSFLTVGDGNARGAPKNSRLKFLFCPAFSSSFFFNHSVFLCDSLSLADDRENAFQVHDHPNSVLAHLAQHKNEENEKKKEEKKILEQLYRANKAKKTTENA